MTAISEERRPEEIITGRHGKCYQDLQKQRLDLVERSTTSKTVEEPNHIVQEKPEMWSTSHSG
jgi:hypothetical protein